MKGAYPSRAALVSLLTVFVLLSALFFFTLLLPRLRVLKQAVGGAVNFPDRFAARWGGAGLGFFGAITRSRVPGDATMGCGFAVSD